MNSPICQHSEVLKNSMISRNSKANKCKLISAKLQVATRFCRRLKSSSSEGYMQVGKSHHIWTGITCTCNECRYNEPNCLVNNGRERKGAEFSYGWYGWWTGAEPNNANPESCGIVGGHLEEENMDLPCKKDVDVDVLCEIDWHPDSYKGI